MTSRPDDLMRCTTCGWSAEASVYRQRPRSDEGQRAAAPEADVGAPFGQRRKWNTGVRLPFDVRLRMVITPLSMLEPWQLILDSNGESCFLPDPGGPSDLTVTASYCCITRWLHGHLRLGRLIACGSVIDLDIGIAGLVTAALGPGSRRGVTWDLDQVDQHISGHLLS